MKESFDVIVGKTDGGVSVWEVLLASAIGKQHTPTTI